ncbi:MAG TPA: DedA family protein [Kofleriaceae bacterium]|nr:DedA family protein [Kofleriaceae bacterium]
MWVGREDSVAGWLALAAAAAIEYVFPPFPGDAITVLAAVLVTAASWSAAGVLSALMVGSMVGAALTFELGLRWAARRTPHAQPHALDRLVAGFRRHGAVYLVINRFVPGIRSLFFVAAGLAGMRRGPVMLCAGISALLWNVGLFALGAALGSNLDRVEGWVRTYTIASIAIVAGAVAIGAGGWAWRRRRAAAAPPVR